MDLSDQLAAVWARRMVVLVVALLVGAAVFAWRVTSPEQFEASSTLQVRPPVEDTSDPALRVSFYADTVIGLVTSRGVVAATLEELGRDEDPDDVVDLVAAEAGTQPGFVTVQVRDSSPARAVELADALVAAVDERVEADQAADREAERDALTQAIADVGLQRDQLPQSDYAGRAALIRERESLLAALRSSAGRTSWQVTTVAEAQEPTSAVSPRPLRDGLLAAIVALLLLAEGIVVRRAWRGALSAREPARDVREAVGVPAVAVAPDDGVGALAALLPQLADAERVSVVHRGPTPSAHTALLVAELLAARGHDVLLVDVASARGSVHRELGVDAGPGFSDLPTEERSLRRDLERLPRLGGARVLVAGSAEGAGAREPAATLARVVSHAGAERVVVAASVERPDELYAVLGQGSAGAVVLDVDGASATKRQLREDAAALVGLQVGLAAATVQTSGGTEGQRLESRRRRGLRVTPATTGGKPARTP